MVCSSPFIFKMEKQKLSEKELIETIEKEKWPEMKDGLSKNEIDLIKLRMGDEG